MVCSKCKTEGYIKHGEIVVEGDNSGETTTKVYNRAVFCCRNPNCSDYGNEIGEKKVLIYDGENGGCE